MNDADMGLQMMWGHGLGEVFRYGKPTLRNIISFIENKLFLKVNKDKIVVDYVGKVKFPGMSFYQYKGKTRVRIHPKSVAKMKAKIKTTCSKR